MSNEGWAMKSCHRSSFWIHRFFGPPRPVNVRNGSGTESGFVSSVKLQSEGGCVKEYPASGGDAVARIWIAAF
jgi:hypothetical protein